VESEADLAIKCGSGAVVGTAVVGIAAVGIAACTLRLRTFEDFKIINFVRMLLDLLMRCYVS